MGRGVKSKLKLVLKTISQWPKLALDKFEDFDNWRTNLDLSPRQQMRLYLVVTTIALPVIFLLVFYAVTRPNYNLSDAAQELVGTADTTTMNGFKYNAADKSYYLNKSAISSFEQQDSMHIGNSVNHPTYSLKLPNNISQGITYYDDKDNLAFNLTPEFNTAPGKLIDGHMVYPINHNEQAVYTVKTDGLKEDLVINHKTSDVLNFSYKLNLPSTMIARRLPSGAIGIFSANPILYGNISYGSSADQANVEKARQNSPKNYLIFALTAPMVFETNQKSGQANNAQTQVSLNGNTITLSASNLSSANYPITIDPSVLVNSLSTFAAGNNEGGIGCITSNNICEAGLTGGSLSANSWQDCSTDSSTCSVITNWTNGSTTNVNAFGLTPQNATSHCDSNLGGRENAATVAYNGYIYIIGGSNYEWNGSSCVSVNLSTVEYAHLNSNGYLEAPTACQISGSGTLTGVWCVSGFSLPAAADNVAAVVYDDYLYIEDTFGTGHYVYYATIDANGSNGDIGTFNTVSNDISNQVTGASLVAYNGYLYLVGGVAGGCSGSAVYEKNVQYAQLNGDGTPGSWNTSTNFDGTNGHAYLAAATYNGYLYVWGGYSANGSCASQASSNALYYVNIASSAPSSWAWTTSSVTLNVANMGYGVYNGYLYTVGGESWAAGTPTTSKSVSYAPINANGSINAWQTNINNVTTGALCDTATAIYNGYLYNLGGSGGSSSTCGDTNNITDVIYNQIDAAGSVGQFTSDSGTAFVNGRAGAGLAAVNGFLFIMGGTSASGGCTSSICNTVYQATIGSDGSIGAWSHSSHDMLVSLTNFAVATYNGYIYTVGGCSNAYTTSCTAVSSNTTYVASVTSAGVLGAFTAQRNFTTDTASARYDAGAFVFDDHLYMVGGYSGASSPLSDMWSIALTSTTGATSGTWSQPTGSSLVGNAGARGSFGYGTYGGYAYIAGGSKNASDGSHCITGSNPFYCNDIYYIQLASGGAVTGSWTSAGTFTSARQHPSLYTWNSYLYISGGDQGSGTYFHDVQFTPLTNGVPGTVTIDTSGSLTWAARTGQTAIAYDGMAYIVGGQEGSNITGCASGSGSTWFCNDSFYAPINAGGPGTVGGTTWTTSGNSLPNAIWGATTVAYNNYLYVVGGFEAAGSFTNNDAAHGGCSSVASAFTVPSNVYSINVVAKGGTAASASGGLTGPGNLGGGGATVTASFWVTPSDTIDTIQGCEAGGDGGGWEPLNQNNDNGDGGGGATQAGNGAGVSTNGPNGGNGTCTGTTAATGAPASNPASDNVAGGSGGCSTHGWFGGGGGGGYFAGAGGGGGTSTGTPSRSPTDGASSAKVWYAAPNSPVRLAQAGGGGGTGLAANANASGSGGDAGCGSASNTNINGGADCASNGSLGQNGGCSASTNGTTCSNGRGGGGGGGSSYCFTTNSLSVDTNSVNSDCTSPNPYTRGTEGTGADGSVVITYTPIEPFVKYAQISSTDGSVGTFSSDTHKFIMTGNGAGEWGVSAAAYNGYLYISGGSDSQQDYADVQYAQLPTGGGALTSNWTQTTNSFTNAREWSNLLAYNGYLYLIGGRNFTDTTYYSDVQYALICTGSNNGVSGCNSTAGNVGTWNTSSHSLPAARAVAGAAVYNGYVYIAGGQQDASTNIRQGTVYYAQLPTNGGDLASGWTQTTGFSMIRFGATLTAYDGYLYLTGGNTGSDVADTQYAPINSNGSIGNWSTSPVTFTSAREEATSVAYNGNLYEISGSASGTLKSDVQYGRINATPRIGYYTYRADNSHDTNPIEILIAGTNTGNLGDNVYADPGGADFTYTFATNGCTTYVSPTQIGNLPSSFMTSTGTLTSLNFTANGCSSTATNVAEYGLFTFKLDDSLTATFPDGSCSDHNAWWNCSSTSNISSHTNITSFTYFYHPNVGYRLRGGATFTQQSLQSLDAPP